MSTENAIFEMRPKTFHCVDVGRSVCPFFGAVIYRVMDIAFLRNADVRLEFIGTEHCSFFYILFNERLQGQLANIRDYLSHKIAAAFHHTENDSLASSTTATLAGPLTTNISFIDFNVPRKALIAVNFAHVFTDFVTHAPSSLVRYAKLSLEFFSRHAVARSGKQVHCIEPRLERSTGTLKGRTSHWVDVDGHTTHTGKQAAYECV